MSDFIVTCDSEHTLHFTDPPSSWQRIAPPPGLQETVARFEQMLKKPTEGPPLADCVVPGDRIAISVDPQIPQLPELLSILIEQLSASGIPYENVTIVCLCDSLQKQLNSRLPEAVECYLHRPENHDDTMRYLASTSDGHRIYLAAPIVDADFIIPMSMARFDELIGISGGTTQLYPYSAGQQAFDRMYQEWHPELNPDDPHSIRQTSDEVGWMTGLTFAIYVLPGRERTISDFVTGLYETGSRFVVEKLLSEFSWNAKGRIENVVCRVQTDSFDDPWWKVVTTLMSAQRLVAKDGRIILLTELTGDLPESMRRLQNLQIPKLGKQDHLGLSPRESFQLSRFVQILKWAQISLYSKLNEETVEELFMTPLSSQSEVRKLLESLDEILYVTDADLLHLTSK